MATDGARAIVPMDLPRPQPRPAVQRWQRATACRRDTRGGAPATGRRRGARRHDSRPCTRGGCSARRRACVRGQREEVFGIPLLPGWGATPGGTRRRCQRCWDRRHAPCPGMRCAWVRTPTTNHRTWTDGCAACEPAATPVVACLTQPRQRQLLQAALFPGPHRLPLAGDRGMAGGGRGPARASRSAVSAVGARAGRSRSAGRARGPDADDGWAPGARNAHALQHCADLVQALATAGMPTIVLKGAALRPHGVSRSGTRPMGDMDILVPTDGAVEALAIGRAHGWSPRGDATPAWDRQVPDIHTFTTDGCQVDVHQPRVPRFPH